MNSNETKAETIASVEQTIVATPDVATETTVTTETVATDTVLVDLQTRIAELESQVASQLEIIEAAKKMKEEEKNEVEDKEEETEAAKKTKEEMAKKDEENEKVKSELDAALEAIAGDIR